MGAIYLGVYLFVLYIRPQDWEGGQFEGLPLMDLAVGLGLLMGFLTLMNQRRQMALPHYAFLVAFLFLAFTSNFVQTGFGDAWAQMVIQFKRLAPFVIVLLLVNSPQQLKWTLAGVVAFTTYLAAQSIVQAMTGIGWAGQPILTMQMSADAFERVRWVGMWDGPNVLGLVFVLAIPLAVGFVLGHYGPIFRLLNLWTIGVLMYGVVLTNSRGSFVAMAGAMLFYLINRFRAKWGIALGGIILPAIWITLAPSRLELLSRRDSSSNERSWLWEQGLNMLRDNPIFGVGKGQFGEHSYGGLIAHNNFVSNMAETGLPGLFVYTALIYLGFKGLFVAQRALREAKNERLLLSLSTALFASFIGFNIAAYFVTMELEIMFLWWGLCASVVLITRQRLGGLPLTFTMKDAMAVCVGMVVVIASIYLIAVREII